MHRFLLSPFVLAAGVVLAAPPDPDDLDRAMDKAQREGLVCLSDAAGSTSAGGELVVRVLVDPEGSLVQPEITRTTIGDPEVVRCVLEAVSRQRVSRGQGGGYAPVQRTLVVWDPPTGAKPVKVQRARKLLGDAIPQLGGCLEALPDTPDRLDVDFLVGDRRVHPLSASLPSEQARCVALALGGGRLGGVGSVRAELRRDDTGGWSIGRIGATSEDQAETRGVDRAAMVGR